VANRGIPQWLPQRGMTRLRLLRRRSVAPLSGGRNSGEGRPTNGPPALVAPPPKANVGLPGSSGTEHGDAQCLTGRGHRQQHAQEEQGRVVLQTDMRSWLRTKSAVLLTAATNLAGLPVRADLEASVQHPNVGLGLQDVVQAVGVAGTTDERQDLATIVGGIERISPRTRARRNLAQGVFCLPQNVVGILCYGLLQITGNVLDTAAMNETTVIVTKTPFGASLGRYIFVNETMQTENTVRHEYGHTLQGYKRGPFFLLFEGLASFVQAMVSLVSPSFAAGYFDRWPENEANELGGVG
jgi:hypothetical protein